MGRHDTWQNDTEDNGTQRMNVVLSIKDTEHNNAQNNNAQQSSTQYNEALKTLSIRTLHIMKL